MMVSIGVEVILKDNWRKKNSNELISACERYLRLNKVRCGTVLSDFDYEKHPLLYENITHIIVEDSSTLGSYVDFAQVNINWYVYALDKTDPQAEIDYGSDNSELQLATIQTLPSYQYFNLWESLVYDNTIKANLLQYGATAMLYADKGVDSNIVSCNRVILLHGPPGTGKTSLCKALAHKLTIRLSNRFKRGFLMEINSHNLFSKWFSESGKLITKIFKKVLDYLEDPDTIIFLLIDEVESLTHAREKCMSGVEPSDSIRVVNALLTQIDKIKNNQNVLVLATSNLTTAIDLAFVDRADIKQYIGLPVPDAIYQIYFSCIEELMKASIIQPKVVISPVNICYRSLCGDFENSDIFMYSNTLYRISELSVGISGRSLRKIPFLAHFLFIHKPTATITEFLDAMEKAVEMHKREIERFSETK